MRTLRTCVLVGIFAIAAGCDTSNAPAPPPPADSGSAGTDSGVSDGSGGGDSTVADGAGDGMVADGASDAMTMDGASDGMVADGAIDGMVADGASDGMVADGASDGSAVDAGSDAKTEDGGGDAKAADSGSDAEAADGGDAGSEGGTCVLPSCLTDLETNCSPSGTCSQTTDSSSGNTYTCYDNGIILGNILDLNGDNTITARTAGSICYSIEYTGNNINNVATDVPVTSGSDAGVAVLHQDIAADGYTPIWSVTCGSAPAVTLDPSCLNTWPLAWIESDGTFDCTGTATCTW